ncbi:MULTISPECIES: UxaA family hydrolase [Bradyrhizobium]|uniref:UxaA family hydrolase n=1 Tax=Bradyrhizobium TaxID=374 RepID=UPI0009F96ACC|nr:MULTISPECIES: altronate dehydratase family protein [Bradyrhizobium]MCP1833745.1 altronate hydrolase [Bradyrhizobium sp. USDA 4545]MCP1918489.1 altronate hydrolase [Bradyrhizobium sp. USDA 4532]
MSDHPDSTATQNVISAARATDRRTQNEKPSTILLNSSDDVLIALRAIAVGETVSDGVVAIDPIPAGHKIARRRIDAGTAVRRYSSVIGVASATIAQGEHVHVHNLGMSDYSQDSNTFGQDVRPTPLASVQRTFNGYVRADGRVATRNYIGVLTSVNCSATAARMIADHFKGRLANYPNIDGVVALTHKSGCGLDARIDGIEALRRCIAGYAAHPNFAKVLMIGLGCEVSNLDGVLGGSAGDALVIQQSGGTAATVRAGIERLEASLERANNIQRTPVPASELKVALQCGGSDGYSGISANAALGAAVDLIVAHGGTAILSETTECYGAEHILTRRAVRREVGEKLAARVKWWDEFAASHGMEINNNPSPGNKAGGLTNIIEKSLGAMAKGGTTNLVEVYDYAERVTEKGLVFMDAPAFDPVGATAQVAGGANVLCFTTGRGSAFGCKPTPSLKLASNTPLYQRMPDDMDVNCGTILDGTETIEEAGTRIFDLILATASGQKTASERLGYGEEEFSPWDKGIML